MDPWLRSVDSLPPAFQRVFNFRYFNAIQSDVFNSAFLSDSNLLLSAPTGSGKSTVFELAILRMLQCRINPSNGQFHHKPGLLKAIYVAPIKALVQEKVEDWKKRFGQTLGLVCQEVTGDTDYEDLSSLDNVDIICTTPEKFDSMTRKHSDRGGMRFFNEIGLVIIDEVHVLSDNRGSALEAGVVSRIKIVSELPEMANMPLSKVRFVAVSATIPNLDDLAAWLEVPPDGVKCYGEEMRPVKLENVVKGYPNTSNDFLFDRRLNEYIYGILNEYSRGKPALVFCPSRNGTSEAAARIAKDATAAATDGRPSSLIRSRDHHQRLVTAASLVSESALKDCLQRGVAYHHAAMSPRDKTIVEDLFRNLDLLVLCTTSTLAMGVNLPAYLVVIKGTRRYAGNEADDASGYMEYDRTSCLQMMGRAGRPGFDTEGVAVVMTVKENAGRYQRLAEGVECVESALGDALPELINAEIVLGTLRDVSTAIDWLKTTFFFIRVQRNPARYKAPRNLDARGLDAWMKEHLVLATVRQLTKYGLVQTDEDGFSLTPLRPGQIMSEHCVKLPTMCAIMSCPAKSTIPELLHVISKSVELSSIKLRRNEKKVLNEINHSSHIRHQVRGTTKTGRPTVVQRISTPAEKIFILVNEVLADQPSGKLEYSLKQDAEQALTVGARLTAAMIQFYIHSERASETFSSLMLHKSLKQKLWSNSPAETKQLAGIGNVTVDRLTAAGVHKLRQLMDLDPRRLESIAQRAYPFGTEVQDKLKALLPPPVELSCRPLSWTKAGCLDFEVTLSRTDVVVISAEGTAGAAAGVGVGGYGGGNGGSSSSSTSGGSKAPCKLLVGSLHDNALLSCRSLNGSTLFSSTEPIKLYLRTREPAGWKGRKKDAEPIALVVSLIHEHLVGVDVAIKTEVPVGATSSNTQQRQQQQNPAAVGNTAVERNTAVPQQQQQADVPPADNDTIEEDGADEDPEAAVAEKPTDRKPIDLLSTAQTFMKSRIQLNSNQKPTAAPQSRFGRTATTAIDTTTPARHAAAAGDGKLNDATPLSPKAAAASGDTNRLLLSSIERTTTNPKSTAKPNTLLRSATFRAKYTRTAPLPTTAAAATEAGNKGGSNAPVPAFAEFSYRKPSAEAYQQKTAALPPPPPPQRQQQQLPQHTAPANTTTGTQAVAPMGRGRSPVAKNATAAMMPSKKRIKASYQAWPAFSAFTATQDVSIGVQEQGGEGPNAAAASEQQHIETTTLAGNGLLDISKTFSFL